MPVGIGISRRSDKNLIVCSSRTGHSSALIYTLLFWEAQLPMQALLNFYADACPVVIKEIHILSSIQFGLPLVITIQRHYKIFRVITLVILVILRSVAFMPLIDTQTALIRLCLIFLSTEIEFNE